MTLLKYYAFLNFALSTAYAFAAPSFEVIHQEDLYLEKNDCNELRKNHLSAINFSVEIPSSQVKQNLILSFMEKTTGFGQVVLYDQKTLFYPDLFRAPGHHEYGLPECDNRNNYCRMQFFIFKPDILKKLPKLNFSISAMSTVNPYTELFRHVGVIETKNKQHGKLFFEHLDIRIGHNEFEIELDKARIRDLIKKGYQIEVSAIWRKNISQIGYSDSVKVLSASDDWVKNTERILKIPHKLKGVTYLAAMVLVQNREETFETKVVKFNTKESFFSNCQAQVKNAFHL